MKLLITGAIIWDDIQIKELEKLGHEIIYIQDERLPLKEQGIVVEEIEGTVCNGLFLYNEISEFKNLQYIQLTSAGYDRVPIDYVKEHHIEIYNARGVYSVPMAEFAVCGILQLYKQSRFFYDHQKWHQWKKHREIMELFGKTVSIVGCGSVGTECAKRFHAFGCNVIGVDCCPRQDENYAEMLGMNYLESVLPQTDIVILTLPLADETWHLMNAHKLGLMKPESILVNIARGAVVDIGALVNTIPNIGGAVLDVFEEEPLQENNPLWNMENVIITPHNSFVGDGNQKRLAEIIYGNLRRRST